MVFVFMVLFFANTIVMSARAKPCVNHDATEIGHDMGTEAESDMPCHNENLPNTNDRNKHCDGICLCLHVSMSQTPIINDYEILRRPDLSKQQIEILHDVPVSITLLPPRRPPKLSS